MSADIRELTTKGTITMFDRYRRIQRELQEEQQGGDEDGFTLIELLIVIVVLGILAAVTVFGLSNVTGQSLTSACHADVKSVAVATEAYHAENSNNWPAVGTAGVVALTATDANGVRYLRSLPGNESKYGISLGANGVVLVQSKETTATFAAGPPPVWTGPAINYEDPTTWVPAGTDPCTNL